MVGGCDKEPWETNISDRRALLGAKQDIINALLVPMVSFGSQHADQIYPALHGPYQTP
jgi:hypothetical protein